jgi:hypothetical protein
MVVRRSAENDRDRHTPAGDGGGARRDLDRIPFLVRRHLPHPPEPLEPLGANRGRRDHGHRHGAGDRVPQHRSVGGLDVGRDRHGHGSLAGRDPAQVARFRPSDDLDHRAVGRPAHGRGPGGISGVHRGLRRSAVVHRHAGRPPRVAGRGLGHGQRAHDRPDGHDIPALGRGVTRQHRWTLELVGGVSVASTGSGSVPCGWSFHSE